LRHPRADPFGRLATLDQQVPARGEIRMLDPVNPPHSDSRNRKPWWLLFAACIAAATACSATDDASTHGAAGGTSAGGSNAGGAGAAAPNGGIGGGGGNAGTVTSGGAGGVAGSIGGAGGPSAGASGVGVGGAAGGLFEGGLGGAAGVFQGPDAAYDGPPYTPELSNRVRIDLGQTPWKFKRVDNASQSSPTFDDSSWVEVGVPHTWNDTDTFINQDSGGGDGSMQGGTGWYRKHFTLDAKYSARRIVVEFEGVHVGTQVYINGTLIPGNSAADTTSTHVLGWVPFAVDLTPYVKFGGADNVLAVRVGMSGGFYAYPEFALAFRFGQADGGLVRPVIMHITDQLHVPLNVYSVIKNWGTYVATVTATDASATVRILTNVQNEGTATENVTLTTRVIDASGATVLEMPTTQAVAAGQTYTFDQTGNIPNPHLWYPNNSAFGRPYMHRVIHVVKTGAAVRDVFESPLGIRTITWDKDFPYINGKKHLLWGASGRYDYPALGSAVPTEQKWRDIKLLAEAGGSLWRPGHSAESLEFVEACDAYGVMLIQPSGEGEGAFSAGQTSEHKKILKTEVHRDMIVRDRNHPSILSWEANNGAMETAYAQSLKELSKVWDPVNTRAQADRTPDPNNGDILGCTLTGCEIGVKTKYPNNPAWGSESWGRHSARFAYDFEIQFAGEFLQTWRKGRQANTFGMAQWYLTETPGEAATFLEGVTGPGVRSFGSSMMDFNRIPKLLYHAYRAAWTPFEQRPVVALAHHWNRTGTVRVNAFSNCPNVRLLINGADKGTKKPNPWTGTGDGNDQNTTQLPMQAWWDVTWETGTLKAECLDAAGTVVASDEKVTAGAPDHIALTLEPPLVRPSGEPFRWTANGTDAVFVLAKVVDAKGIWCPTASNPITFSVSGPAEYRGGSDQYVTIGKPLTYHSPTDPELNAEGGMCKVAVRSRFTPGTVTVTATSAGLGQGTVSYAIAPL
jgi:beta-galactosidase